MTTSRISPVIGSKPSFAKSIERRRVHRLLAITLLIGLFGFSACEAGSQPANVAAKSVKPEEWRMWMIVGERRFAIALSDNPAAREFAARLPLTLDMDELNGNEKKADLAQALPTNASRPGTIRNGDIMLYGANTVVVFYLSFESSYAYTRLGRVDDPAGLAEALGRRGVRVVFTKDR